MAEAIARRLAAAAGSEELEFRSAGTSTVPGLPASEGALRAALRHDLTLVDHVSNPLSRELIDWADLILTNGHFYTVNPEQLRAEALAVKDGKILALGNAKDMEAYQGPTTKVLDLDEEESQYFLDITNAKAISGYGHAYEGISSSDLDKAFFNLFREDDNMFDVVEELHQRHYNICKLLDFRLYY